MNLDDIAHFKELDPQNMLAHIEGLPDQLKLAWEQGQSHELPPWTDIRQVVVAGMGGSAIGADLVAAYALPLCSVPIIVHRDYNLPAWVSGPQTLVVASSHSGNTEETLTAFEAALARGCRCLAFATGGKLGQAAAQAGVPAWLFDHKGQPRAAVGFSFGLLLAALARLALIPDPGAELQEAIAAMRLQQTSLRVDVPAANNPAKRIAGQLVGRWVMVFGADVLAPVARRWKGQINELAKAWAQFEFLPEADHNSLAGTLQPEALLPHSTAIFLRSPSDHPRNRQRSQLTRQALMLEGISSDLVDAQGQTRLAHLWTCLHLGDYVAYYLAMAYGVDPTPIEGIERFKIALQAAS
jgi:glucose/mannose-6-phosphate isomerase